MALIDDTFWHDKQIVALAGGVGGAKLAHGLAQVLPDGHLTVIVNTGDDFEHYGLHISPDLDTVMYTLTGHANPATGWGVVDETWQAAEMLEIYGENVWFRLGDRDLATHLIRTHALKRGATLTEVTARLSSALGLRHQILPATDDPLATIVQTKEHGELAFQDYFVRQHWQPLVTELYYAGAESAQATSQVIAAFEAADLIVICPSNPMLSIAPLLAPKGVRSAVENRRVPCVAVSPLIGGQAVKGPTAKLMQELGLDNSHLGVARFYEHLIDGLVVDENDVAEAMEVKMSYPNLSVLLTPTLMTTIADRCDLSIRVLKWSREVLM